MIIGAGHVMDMIGRMTQNLNLRTSSRSKFKDNIRDNIYSASNPKKNIPRTQQVNQKYLAEIKKKMAIYAKRESRKERILSIVFLILGAIVMIGIILWVNSG